MSAAAVATLGLVLGRVGAGVAFGRPGPWSDLAEITMPWVLGAFVAGLAGSGRTVGRRALSSGLRGAIALIVATWSYYDAAPMSVPPRAANWIVVGCVVGAATGVCASFVRSDSITRTVWAAAPLPLAVCLDLMMLQVTGGTTREVIVTELAIAAIPVALLLTRMVRPSKSARDLDEVIGGGRRVSS